MCVRAPMIAPTHERKDHDTADGGIAQPLRQQPPAGGLSWTTSHMRFRTALSGDTKRHFHEHMDVWDLYRKREPLTSFHPAAYCMHMCAACLRWIEHRESVSVPSLSTKQSTACCSCLHLAFHDNTPDSAKLYWQHIGIRQADGPRAEKKTRHWCPCNL